MNPRKGKMRNLFYTELKIQEYLKDNRITTSQARAVFRYKTRMANFSEKFKGVAKTKPCPMCKDALDTQPLLLPHPPLANYSTRKGLVMQNGQMGQLYQPNSYIPKV